MNNISFKGRFVSTANVLKKSKNGQFIPHKVSLVELDTANKNDILALKSINESWKGAKCSKIIYEDANEIYETQNNAQFSRFFILTNQKKNFSKLNPKDILVELQLFFVSKAKQIDIMFQQADPKHKFDSLEKQYKHLGTGLLDAIKQIFSNKDITLSVTKDSKDFYFKNGFKLIAPDCNETVCINKK